MPTYTVVGMHEPYGETFAEQETAEGPHAAIRAVATRKNDANADAQILGALELPTGAWTAACEDSGHSAHVSDLADGNICRTEGCNNSTDDGEGYDGMCGECADKAGSKQEDEE